MRDYKNLHTEIIEREDHSWQRGWRPGTAVVTGILWGVIVVELVLIGVGK